MIMMFETDISVFERLKVFEKKRKKEKKNQDPCEDSQYCISKKCEVICFKLEEI